MEAMPASSPGRPLAVALVAASMTVTFFARADETAPTPPHRISGAFEAAVANELWDLGEHGAKIDLQLRGAYAYRLLTGLELGGSVGYWVGAYTKGFVTEFRLRPYLSPSEDVEIGMNFGLGMFIRPSSIGEPEDGLGGAWSLGPDVRGWVSGAIGVEGSIDLNRGCRHGDPFASDPQGRCFFAVGVGVGAVGRL
jgi:hypothetical protein